MRIFFLDITVLVCFVFYELALLFYESNDDDMMQRLIALHAYLYPNCAPLIGGGIQGGSAPGMFSLCADDGPGWKVEDVYLRLIIGP